MKNFQVTSKEDGKKYWISRSCAITAIILTKDFKTNTNYVLVSKRGEGCPDENGKWNITCGYLDWGETLEDAVKREVFEETGYDIPKFSNITLWKVNSNPKSDKRENVCFRYIIRVPYNDIIKNIENGTINIDTESRGGEGNEVSEIKLISLNDIDKLNWAFNHKDILKNLKV